MKVSVILTSYNRPQLVKEAIASVRAQTYTDWELLIIDDNSNQETKEALVEAAKDDPRCIIIHSGVKEEDRGKTTRYCTCINMAISRLTGDLVTYLADDDLFYPERLEVMVKEFQENPDIYVVYGRQRLVSIDHEKRVEVGVRSLVGVTRSPACQIDHNSIMHRRECFDVVCRWDDHPMHWGAADAIFFSSIAQYWDFHPIDYITDEHRFHSDSIQSRMIRGEKPF